MNVIEWVGLCLIILLVLAIIINVRFLFEKGND